MNPKTVIAIILIVAGVLTLVYQGISYTTREKHEIGPIEVETKETKQIPLPPILGVIALAGGIILLVVSGKP